MFCLYFTLYLNVNRTLISAEVGLGVSMEADSVLIILELAHCQQLTWVDHLDLSILAQEFLAHQVLQPTLVSRPANQATQIQDQVFILLWWHLNLL